MIYQVINKKINVEFDRKEVEFLNMKILNG